MMNSKSIFKHEDIIQKSMYYIQSGAIALVRENRGVMGVRSGINRDVRGTQLRQIYMNGEHMVAGSERKRGETYCK